MTEGDQERPSEARPLDFRLWRGVTGAISVAVFGVALTVAAHPPSAQPSRYVAVEREAPLASSSAPDPLMAKLIRCRALSPQVDDARCRAAWEENRRRFFGESRAMRVPGDPLPTYAPIPTPER